MAIIRQIAAGVCAAALAYGYQAMPPATQQASIEVQVFNGSTGAPLKRATVRLNGQPLNPDGANRQTAVRPIMLNKDTDDQGRFSFTGLEAGRYRLSAERTGFLRQSYGARKYSGGGS